MKSKIILLSLLIFLNLITLAQDKIAVTETTVKVNSLTSEKLYFAFDAGDQVIFNYELEKGKDLKKVEILEYPEYSIFMDYKTTKITDKVISINKKGIYMFKFKNSSLSSRICKVKIERIPANSSNTNFNTTVYWKTVNDTTSYFLNEDYLISKDTAVVNITDRVTKVPSATGLEGHRTSFNFTLPQNTVSWSYYIGVDQAGQEVLENATKELAINAGPLVAKIPGYGPLAALALGGTSYLVQLQGGEDINYYIVEGENVNLFLSGSEFYYKKKGKVVNDFSKMTSPLKGSYHFCLSNDNIVTGVNVTVNIVAITVKENWGVRKVEKFIVVPRQEPYMKE